MIIKSSAARNFISVRDAPKKKKMLLSPIILIARATLESKSDLEELDLNIEKF